MQQSGYLNIIPQMLCTCIQVYFVEVYVLQL